MSQQEGSKKTVQIAPAATSSTPLGVNQVLEDINKIKNQIEEVQQQNIEDVDPEFKENAKKLMQIKKFIAKKTKSPETSKSNFWKKLKSIRRRRGIETDSMIEITPTHSEILEMYGTSEGRSSEFSNYSVDEAFMYGAECILALMDIFKVSE